MGLFLQLRGAECRYIVLNTQSNIAEDWARVTRALHLPLFVQCAARARVRAAWDREFATERVVAELRRDYRGTYRLR